MTQNSQLDMSYCGDENCRRILVLEPSIVSS